MSVTFGRRERQVIYLIFKGKSSPEIAERLAISKETVHIYVRRIYQKSGYQCRPELIAHYKEVLAKCRAELTRQMKEIQHELSEIP